MIFSELHGAYFTTVSKIIEEALRHPVSKNEIRKIAEKYAFGESVAYIEDALASEKWQLICADGTTPIRNKPEVPLTTLQKRWLKAISLDPRMQLFGDAFSEIEDVTPLFTMEDVVVFDKYLDGDPYEDETYKTHFRQIMDALENEYPLKIMVKTGKGRMENYITLPEYLEYSEKDDKFRLIGSGGRHKVTVNVARIISCEPYSGRFEVNSDTRARSAQKQMTFELVDERNTLERVLLHFAHFEKQAEKLDENHYKVTIIYDQDDETEILIRILSFGPTVKVTSPNSFINLIKERLLSQKSCVRS